jgi:hypothetical protein
MHQGAGQHETKGAAVPVEMTCCDWAWNNTTVVDYIGQTMQARCLWLGMSEDASIEQGHQPNKLVTLVM